MLTTPTFRTIAAGGALAVAATSGVMLASPANAAESATLNYICNSPNLGDFPVTAKHAIPDTLVYGGKVAVTTTMTLTAETVGGLNFFGFNEVKGGTANNNGVASVPVGSLPVQFQQNVGQKDVPAAGPMDLVAIGDVDTAPYAGATPAGTSVGLAMSDIDGADIAAVLTLGKADGWSGDAPVDCELADGQDLTVGDVTVVKAGTETTAKLAYKKKAKKMIGKAAVDAPESGVDAAGQVKFTLKRNGKKVGSKSAELNANERAKAVFKNIKKKGKYKVVAKYVGGDNFMGSKDGSPVKKV